MAVKKQKRQSTRHLIKDMKLMMESKPSYTVESYVFGEDDAQDEPGDAPYADDMHNSVETTPKADINGRIQQIRKLVLQSLAEIADDPTSTEYDLFKKLLNLCDKTIEMKANGGKPSKVGNSDEAF